ncbi:hypothetical protein Tco_0323944 [Tanacetum coccineum]
MVSFRLLHSHLKVLSNNNLKGTRIEEGFKQAFATLFCQDVQIFTGTMLLNVDQLEKQLDKEEFQKIGSMAAFKVLETQVNERQMQKEEEKVDTSKALDASLVDTESSGTESGEQDTSSRSGNDAHAYDADIRPIYDEESMAEVQTTAKINVFAIGQQHADQPNFNNEGEVDQNAEQFQSSTSGKGFAIVALKNALRKLAGNSVYTKFAKPSILRKPILQPYRNQLVVRQPTTFKPKRPRILKPQFSSQIDVKNDLPKPVTTHYLPKERESAFAKPHHVIAPSSSRNSSNSVSTLTPKKTYGSNDMIHNYYLEDARKKTQERGRNSKPSVIPSVISQSTANGSKPKPRSDTQTSRNWHASKNSSITTTTVPIAEHSRNSRNFSDFKHFVCLTCQKCVFNANYDACVTKFLNEVNSRDMIPFHKTTKRYKPIEQISISKKPERQIPTKQSFQSKRLPLWVPTGKIFTFSATKVDSEPPHGSNTDITNLHECIQNLDSSVGASINVQEEQTLNLSVGTPLSLKKERIKVWIKENVISGRPRRRCSSLTPAESNSLPHAQASKTYYKHQDSRIKKAKVQTKTKTSATLIFKIFLKDIKIIKTKIVKGDC